ncbi:MAG: EF-P lysine aminoacylase EpmA [bacterium]|nr:EF-P lysine aminoacylase EpmA [bacterium]
MKSQLVASHSKHNLLTQRAQIISLLRAVLNESAYLEVETPQRVRSAGTDLNLDPFETEERYLITSPEFHLKVLLAQGYARIYQICHCFRKGERTALHNPEFTMLEFYASGMDLSGMMIEVETITKAVAEKFGRHEVSFRQKVGDLSLPWERISVDEAFQKYAGWKPSLNFDEDRFYFDLVDQVDPHLGIGRPSILYDYPARLAMLASLSTENPSVARRFEVYVCGVEIANAFEELTDPTEQRRRFEEDLRQRAALNKPPYPIDERLLEALPDMPPCSGIAVGVDRLVMLLTGADSVDQVIAFPDEEV